MAEAASTKKLKSMAKRSRQVVEALQGKAHLKRDEQIQLKHHVKKLEQVQQERLLRS